MSVIAPVTAVTAAAVPVLVGLLTGDRIGVWAAVGIALALAAVVLVSAEGGLRALRPARPASLLPALLAGVAFGFFFVLLDRTARRLRPHPAGRRAAGLGRAGRPRRAGEPAAAAGHPGGAPARRSRPGVGDMTANALFLLATQQEGQLAITGVLASLYPVSTVVLAQVVLRERLVGAQVAGLGAAVAAVVLITLPG